MLIVRDVYIYERNQHKNRSEKRKGIYEKYAQPLSQDSANLMWRLHEVLVKKRGEYLGDNAPQTRFNTYKRVSTCYRIATVIAWVRAIRRESSYIFYSDDTSTEDIRKAVTRFESALADGPHIELYVLKEVAKLWSLKLPADEEQQQLVAAQTAAELQHFVHDHGLKSYYDIEKISEESKIELSQMISKCVCEKLGQTQVDANILRETKERAAKVLGVRQAFIYREWQSAIGDLMLKEIEDSNRRFEVVGFGEFEALYDQSDKWVDRLKEVVVGVDVRDPRPSDFRFMQMKNVAGAVADIVVSLSKLDVGRKIVDAETLAAAQALSKRMKVSE